MHWSLERKVHLGFGVALVTLGVIGVVSYRSATASVASTGLVARTLDVLQNLAATVADMADAETGARGYVITGQDSFLEPYDAATSEVAGLLQHLRELTADNPRQQRRLDSLEPLVAEKLRITREQIELRRGAGFAPRTARRRCTCSARTRRRSPLSSPTW